MLALSSCNQAPQAELSKEPSLEITTTQTEFQKGKVFNVSLEIYSPEDSSVNINIVAPKNLGINQEPIQITIAAGQTKTFELQGTPKRSGYYNITANATGRGWHEPASDMLGFNVATDALGAAKAGTNAQTATGLESLEKHLENIPKINTPEEYAALSTAQTLDDIKDLDNVRLDSRLDNLQFKKQDGTKSEPFNTVVTYIPDTGSGKPRPEDLVPPSASRAKANLRPQGWCGTGALATVTAKITYNGKSLLLPYTKIAVFDENPWLAPAFVASGYTNANGQYSFYKPWCDWGAAWGV